MRSVCLSCLSNPPKARFCWKLSFGKHCLGQANDGKCSMSPRSFTGALLEPSTLRSWCQEVWRIWGSERSPLKLFHFAETRTCGGKENTELSLNGHLQNQKRIRRHKIHIHIWYVHNTYMSYDPGPGPARIRARPPQRVGLPSVPTPFWPAAKTIWRAAFAAFWYLTLWLAMFRNRRVVFGIDKLGPQFTKMISTTFMVGWCC